VGLIYISLQTLSAIAKGIVLVLRRVIT